MKSKHNLSVYKVVNKSLIAWNINNSSKIPIYYKFDTKRLPKINKKSGEYELPFILIDYDYHKREWYVQYVTKDYKILSCTVNDITGDIYIASFD